MSGFFSVVRTDLVRGHRGRASTQDPKLMFKQLLLAVAMTTGAVSFAQAGETCVTNLNPNGSQASYSGGVACGNSSKATGNYATSYGHTSNATGYGSVALGTHNLASGSYAIVLGHATEALADSAVAIGNEATAAELNSTAVGVKSDIRSQGGAAFGNSARVTGLRAVALGTGSQALADASVALGEQSIASRARTISVGRTGAERQVTNVADGVEASDAVTLRQLQALKDYVDERLDNARASSR